MTMASAELERSFRLEEATIGQLHAAIRAGETTCVAVVEHYLARVRAYNGVASALVTADGASVAPATGTVRGGTALSFPTRTVKALRFCPTSTGTTDRRSNTAAWRPPPPTLGCSSSSA